MVLIMITSGNKSKIRESHKELLLLLRVFLNFNEIICMYLNFYVIIVFVVEFFECWNKEIIIFI